MNNVLFRARKGLSLFLATLMILGCLPLSIIAEGDSGDDFIEVRTVDDLYNVRDDLAADYILMNDIDLTEATAPGGIYDFMGNGWNPIGSNDLYSDLAFSGTFDGNGYTIRGLRINVLNKNLPSGITKSFLYVGLFAKNTGTIKNLTIEGTVKDNTYNTSNTGAFAGYNTGLIENCVNKATVFGQNYQTVKYEDTSSTGYVGGICGRGGTVQYCYNIGNVRGKGNIDNRSSGGYSTGSWNVWMDSNVSGISCSGTIKNCYNAGTIETLMGSEIRDRSAGISYGGKIIQSYNVGQVSGGYALTNSGTVSGCYYLSGTGKTVTGATVLNDSQMKMESMYKGFDFDTVWVMNPYADYPYPQLRSNPQNLNEPATELVIYSLPNKTEYYIGETVVIDGMVAKATLSSGKTESVEITNDMLAEYDNTTAGTKTITINFRGAEAEFEVEYSVAPSLVGLELISGPDKTTFTVATEFDFTGCVVRETYDNGKTKDIPLTYEMTTGGNIRKLGKQTITFEKEGCSVFFQVTVEPVKLVGIRVKNAPEKTVYKEGEALDVSGLVVEALFDAGEPVVLSEGYTLSGYSSDPGVKTVTVSYSGYSDTFEVTVNEKEVSVLTLVSGPVKTDYFEDEDLDLSGVTVSADYDNGTTSTVENYTVSGYTGKIGTDVITLSYGGKSVFFTVRFKADNVTSLKITTPPAKLAYVEGDDLDFTGLSVAAEFLSGRTEEVKEYTCTGYSPMPGKYTVSVNYKGMFDTFEVEVSAKTMVELTVASPAKVNYVKGEKIDLSGMVVTAVYNNGQTSEVFDYTVTGFDPTTVGTQNVGVTYGGFTRYFPVVVRDVVAVATEGTFIGGKMIARLGEDVTVKFELKQNPGVSGFRHTVEFDADSLDFVDAKALGDLAGGTFVVNDEKKADGEVTLLWIGSGDVRTDGDAYELSFKVRETATDGDHEIKIVFEDKDHGNTAGDRLAFNSVSGNIEVRSYWQGDLTGDRLCKMADLLTLAQYVSGKTMTLTEKQLKAADVDENGEIDIHDVILLRSWILDN